MVMLASAKPQVGLGSFTRKRKVAEVPEYVFTFPIATQTGLPRSMFT